MLPGIVYLLKESKNILNMELFDAARNGREKRQDVDILDNYGRSLLMLTALGGHSACMKILVDRGADINAADNEGRTALMWAAFSGHGACLKLLLDRGADVNVQNTNGWTALICAACSGHSTCLTMLLDRGAGVNTVTHLGRTALMWASWKGHDACIKILVDRGADVNVQDFVGWTALQWAVHGRDTLSRDTIIVELVKAGDRSWNHVPTPCQGLERAFRPVYTTAPNELPELFRRLRPCVQDVVRSIT